MAVTLTSWNIHRGVGGDGRCDPARILRVLRDEVLTPQTDILILQEADAPCRPHAAVLDRGALEDASGLRSVHGPAATRWGAQSLGFLGVVVLARPGLAVEAVRVLDLPGHCHRGAVVVDFGTDVPFRLVGTHLSLGQPARIAQMRVIGQHLMRRDARPVVLAGDLNEWRPWGGLAVSPRLVGTALRGPARPSFPVRRPVLPLDRVLAAAPAAVRDVAVLDGPGIRDASDHRPIRAEIAFSK